MCVFVEAVSVSLICLRTQKPDSGTVQTQSDGVLAEGAAGVGVCLWAEELLRGEAFLKDAGSDK